jgi:hypothetical protein
MVAVLLASLALPAAALAHGEHPPVSETSVAPAGCPGDPIRVDRAIDGEFASSLEGSYVLLPFQVPAGTTAVRVKYCYDQPEAPTSQLVRHTLDLGLYEPRRRAGGLFGEREFRGWGGSSHPDVTVSPEGFSSEQQYLDEPKGHVPGKTTRGFLPGPIPPGDWAVELGVAAVASQTEGDLDGKVAWRVEIELTRESSYADEPYRPAQYDALPARLGAGWYAGDMHVHAEHSSLGDATMRETFDFAFRPLEEGGAGLDFITLSDYVTSSGWGEIGRHQERYPGRLIARSSEVITYRGHANNHVSVDYVDYRTGPIYERASDGRLTLRRSPRPASGIFDAVRDRGGFTQVNHPTIFPSSVPLFALLCRGCPWDYSSAETRYAKVDAIEVATGPSGLNAPGDPGPNPFTATAIDFYERALAEGHRIAAVGSSDSHNAGRTPNPLTQAPIGEATTVVYAEELSERGLREAVQRGHTYVKVGGNGGPDLRFEATTAGGQATAIMGDTLADPAAGFTARVLGADSSYQLLVFRDGSLWRSVPVTGDPFELRFDGEGFGRYRLQLQRDSFISAVSSPIYLRPD